ncbi:MAG: hypothetical protein KDD60_03310 [Bdellovibrionales bacterium]|nr:hypothetical protein [Bdellovibrionales bacterium]
MEQARSKVAQRYQQAQSSYAPKQSIQCNDSGETDLSYYEQLTQTIVEALSIAQTAPEEAINLAISPARISPPVSPALENAISERRARLSAYADQYVRSLGLDPDTPSGKERMESTLEFYSRSESLTTRFEALAKSLSAD